MNDIYEWNYRHKIYMIILDFFIECKIFFSMRKSEILGE